MTSDESLQKEAEETKTKGNTYFSKSKHDEAIAAYSSGLVTVNRLIIPSPLLKATLLSNRAMSYLKLGKFQLSIDDCTSALSLSFNDLTLRNKIQFRRAKSKFLLHNYLDSSSNDLLHDAAKDVLEVLNHDPNNSEASNMLRSIRGHYSTLQTKYTPISKALQTLANKNDSKATHHLKLILGLLENDAVNATMELGRCGGVAQMLALVRETLESNSSTAKNAIYATQCLSISASYPTFVRSYCNEESLQSTLLKLIKLSVSTSSSISTSDLIVSLLALYDKILLHLDRDDLDKSVSINGYSGINTATLVEACQVAVRVHDIIVIRAVFDVLNVWTAGSERSAFIRAGLGTTSDPLFPPPLSQAELRVMSPKDTAIHRKREYEQKTRDQAWAYERGIYFVSHRVPSTGCTGLQTLLTVASTCFDHVIRREITVTVGRILNGIESEDKMKELLAPLLSSPTNACSSVVIEEINDSEDEKKEVDSNKSGSQSINIAIERSIIVTAVLMSRKEVGAWALGSDGWKTCAYDLPMMIESGDTCAMCSASELVSAAATLPTAKDIIETLIRDGYMQKLILNENRDIRSGAASAVAKIDLAQKTMSSDEDELMELLQESCDLLEDNAIGDNLPSVTEKKSYYSKLYHYGSFASSSVERGIEMMNYLVANTVIKEELAAGFQLSGASHTALTRLVEISCLPNAGESLSGFGLASIFQNLSVTNLQLRKEMFDGKEVTMEQYDEMQKMSKTEEEKEFMEMNTDLDSSEACNARVRKLANAHVPRATVALMDGASEHTLDQLVLTMNRMAGEPSARGIMIQEGVLTACIKIEKDEGPTETDTMSKVIRTARHCIAKLLITTNPSLLTSAQRLGSARPLIHLVRDINASDLQHFESLLALTNIASSGDDAKNRIVSERGIGPIHFAMFSDHEMVQRAATEAMCNLVPHKAMIDHLSTTENAKLWLAFASDFEERYECARAAAGCLAMATQDKSIALVLIKLENFGTHMRALVESGKLEIMLRALHIVQNLVSHADECRKKIESEGLIAFCIVYVDKYTNSHCVEDLDFSSEEQKMMSLTLDLAKQILSLLDD